MTKEVVEALSRKDADFLEKFVRKVLLLAKAEKAAAVTTAYENLRENPEGYNTAFNQWQWMALTSVLVDEEIAAKKDRSTEDTK